MKNEPHRAIYDVDHRMTDNATLSVILSPRQARRLVVK